MEEKGQQGKDRVSPPSISALPLHGGDGLVPDNYMDKPISPKNERIVSPNPSPDTAIAGSMRNFSNQTESLNASGTQIPVNQSNMFTPPDQTYFYGGSGYDDGSANWGDYSNYVHSNNLQIVPPAIYNDSASLLFHPAYGFDAQVAYGQFSPVASPLSPIMIDGQLFSPHQVPMSPNFYSQPVSPHVTSSLLTDLSTPANSGQDSLADNMFFGPGSGYYLQYGSYGGANPAGNNNHGFYKYPGDIGSAESAPNRSMYSETSNYASPLTSGGLYPAPVGMIGSYEHIFGQIPQQQTAYGYGSVSGSSTRRYPQSGSYRGHNGNSIFHGEASRLNRFVPDKGVKHRDRDAISMINEPHGTTSDRNRGPRASKPKGNINSSPEHNISPAADGKKDPDIELYNQPDFVTSYDNAKFFVIKSFSEDNVHKSIKYSVWASTPLGNRKLDAAYQEAKESPPATCPVFLFFSVNASGQFCGVAEMGGPVDFVNDAEYWQQDRWSGQFRVKWHIIKDVPNSLFRHILLENNDHKPVTHSRDSQEVKLEAGNAMLKIFKDHDADTSILDDFSYYDDREKDLQEKRSALNDTSITQLADKVAESLHVEEHREVQ